MDFNTLIDRIDSETYASLKRGVELGKWPDGRVLTDEQKRLSMQAIIAWEHQHVQAEQHTGYIDKGSKSEGEVCDSTEEQPVKFIDEDLGSK